MTITITKDEVQAVVNALGEVPSKYTYELLKFFDAKLAEAKKAEEPKEEPKAENA